MKKLIALLLAVVMVASLAACGAKPEAPAAAPAAEAPAAEAPAAEAPQEITKISFYPQSANAAAGELTGHMGNLFASVGLDVEVWAFSAEKTNAILASGDLPDVMCITNKDDLKTLIEGDMILNLDENMDKLPHAQTYEPLDAAMNYMRKFNSADTGELYALPLLVGPGSVNDDTERYSLALYWDYYYELGCPEFNSMEELIPILKQMVENHPVTADGLQTYATASYYVENQLPFIFGYADIFGYDYKDNLAQRMVIPNMAREEVEYFLSEDGILREGLEFYNKLYREGLFDPNSINQDRATTKNLLLNADQYLISLPDCPAWEPDFYQVYFDGQLCYYPNFSTFGDPAYICINKNSENLDAALKFVDCFCNPDFYLVWRGGPDGELWSADASNVTTISDGFLEHVKNGGGANDYPYSNGEINPLFNQSSCVNYGAYTSYFDEDGEPRTSIITHWKECRELANDNDNYREWSAQYGVANWRELIKQYDAYITESNFKDADSFISSLSDDQKLTSSAVWNTVRDAAWKMVYAESDAEFEAIWEKMISDAEGLGAKELYDWAAADYMNAVDIKNSVIGG